MLDKDLIKRKIAFIARELVALAKYKEMTIEETAQRRLLLSAYLRE